MSERLKEKGRKNVAKGNQSRGVRFADEDSN